MTDTIATNIVVIVTGGSTGSGGELSRALAGRGYTVVVVYLDDQRGAEAVVDGIVGANGTAIAVRADLSDELDVERLFRETDAAFGGVDVIVHADQRAVQLVNQQAVGKLRDCGAIVSIGISEAITPFLNHQLRARGITIAGPPPGRGSSGPRPDITCSDTTFNGINYCLSILERWRLSSEGSDGD